MCDLKRITPDERAAAAERKREGMRRWHEANREQQRAYMREYGRTHAAQISAKSKKRYRDDPEFRARKLAHAARWHREHPDERRAISKRYYLAHFEECRLRCKLSKLRRYRREHAR